MFDKRKPHTYLVGDVELTIPDDWRAIVGEDVLQHKISLKERLNSLGISPRNFKDCLNCLSEDFRSWYNPVKERSLEAAKSKERRIEKLKETNLKRFGSVCPLHSKQVADKRKETFRRTLGVDNPFKDKAIQASILEARVPSATREEMERILRKNTIVPIDIPQFFSERYDYKGQCAICGRTFTFHFLKGTHITSTCPFCNKTSTLLERQIAAYLDSAGFKIIPHYRPENMDRKEIDIYLPEQKIGFEINGAFTHNSGFNFKSDNRVKDPGYHKRKTEMADALGIKLYHLWEDWGVDKIMSVLNAKLGIYEKKLVARKLQLTAEADSPEIREFFDFNHTLCSTRADLSLCLRAEGKIVQAMQFQFYSKMTILSRNATELGTLVTGGTERLFSHALKLVKDKAGTIVTYALRDLTPRAEDCVYNKLGFTLVHDSQPSLFYYAFKNIRTKEGIVCRAGLYNRQQFMKNKIAQRFNGALLSDKTEFVFNPDETEQQNLARLQIYPVYNSGCWKFILSLDSSKD